MASYTNHAGREIKYFRNYDKEDKFIENGITEIPGYLVKCTDGNTYLLFAPDMDAVQHMHCYNSIMSMVQETMTDHMYDPVRPEVHPAFTDELDEYGDNKVLHAPVTEMGKIYRVSQSSL